jgi:hypothetical protein
LNLLLKANQVYIQMITDGTSSGITRNNIKAAKIRIAAVAQGEAAHT